MNRPTPASTHHDTKGIRKRSANIQHRGQIRWIQEFPDKGQQVAVQEEPSISGPLIRSSHEQYHESSKIYRTTSTGERRLRAPLLNTYLLADSPLRMPIGSAQDPFSNFPAPWKPPFGVVTSYFKYAVAPAIVKESFDTEGITQEAALKEIDWPLTLSVNSNDAALFYANICCATVHLPDSHEFSPRSNPYFFQWLASKCVEHLNRSLAVPSRACSDSSLAAVTFISFCESMAGSHRIASTIHQPGLMQMVKNRGGLKAISESSVTGARVAHLITAFDIVVATEFRSAPTFTESNRLALQGVELNDILPRIKWEAECSVSPASSPRTGPHTPRLQDLATPRSIEDLSNTTTQEYQLPLR